MRVTHCSGTSQATAPLAVAKYSSIAFSVSSARRCSGRGRSERRSRPASIAQALVAQPLKGLLVAAAEGALALLIVE
jgi:hypothetical protein